MKTLTVYFLKRWWGFYLAVFILNTFLSVVSEPFLLGIELARGSFAFVCVFVFLNYLQKGGNGVFWLPLTRHQIGRVYWIIAILFPSVIFAVSELLGIWLTNSGNLSLIWAVMKHCVFFGGILSALFFTKNVFATVPLIIVLFIHWPKFLSGSHPAVKMGWVVLSLLFIVMTFLRADRFLVTRIIASKPKPRLRKRSWWNLLKFSKQTGMMWILETTFWNVARTYLFIIVVIILLTLLPSFAHFDSKNAFGIFLPLLAAGLIPSAEPISLLISNLRVARILPYTTNQLAGWVIGLTFGTAAFLGLLTIPIAVFQKMPFALVILYYLALLEVALVVQTTAIFVGERGLRGMAAIISAVTILLLVGFVFAFFELFTVMRLISSILISIPIAFLVHRHCLKVGSELYRLQRNDANVLSNRSLEA